MEDIGPYRFAGVTSDSTGNTKVARKLLRKNYPWLLDLPDPCHAMNLLISDICKLPAFQPAIAKIRRTLTYFSHSTSATTKLKAQRKVMKIPGNGLEAIGDTRFATIFYAAQSLRKCMPAIQALVGDNQIEVTVSNKNNTK